MSCQGLLSRRLGAVHKIDSEVIGPLGVVSLLLPDHIRTAHNETAGSINKQGPLNITAIQTRYSPDTAAIDKNDNGNNDGNNDASHFIPRLVIVIIIV